MADDDSDWSDEGEQEEERAIPQPSASASVAAPTSQPAASKGASSQSAAAAASSSPSSAPQQPTSNMLLTLGVQLSLPTHPTLLRPFIAGATLLDAADAAGKHTFSLLFYDQTKRPLILENVEANRAIDISLPLSPNYTPVSDSNANIVDKTRNKWLVQFQSRAHAFKFFSTLCLLNFAARASPSDSVVAFYSADMKKGEGKTLKPKYFVRANVSVWPILMEKGFCSPNFTAISEFDPEFEGSGATPPLVQTTIEGIEMPEQERPSGLPQSISDALAKMKVEGQRVVIVLANSPLASAILAEADQTVANPQSTALIIYINPIEASKKRKEKKEKKDKKKEKEKDKEKKEKEKDQTDRKEELSVPVPLPKEEKIALPTAPFEPSAQKVEQTQPELTPPSLQPVPSEEATGQDADTEEQITNMMNMLKGTAASVNALQPTQGKLFKFIMSSMYDNMLADLGLNPQTEDAAAKATIDKLQGRIREGLSEFSEKNTLPQKGTLTATVTAFHSFLSAFQPLVEGDGLLTKDGRAKMLRKGGKSEEDKREMEELRRKVDVLQKEKAALLEERQTNQEIGRKEKERTDKLKKELDDVGKKQVQLATSSLEAEEKLTAALKEKEEAMKKAAMLEVFEKGLADLRKVLDTEVEEKNKLENELSDLLHFQKNFKLTWLPDKTVKNCMLCKSKFSVFGKSKNHCRYCGRIYCKSCTTSLALPEFGYKEKVRVCKSCYEFKTKTQAEDEDNDAGNAHDDEDTGDQKGDEEDDI